MSKKELIINGVDVSGCIYLWGYDECIVQNEHCKKFEYCHYKQLQRVKFENENNKEMVASAENLINENAFLLGELEQLTMERERETEGVVDAFNCYFTARKTAMPSNPLPARQIHSEKWFAAKNESVKKFKELLAELGRGQDGNT